MKTKKNEVRILQDVESNSSNRDSIINAHHRDQLSIQNHVTHRGCVARALQKYCGTCIGTLRVNYAVSLDSGDRLLGTRKNELAKMIC
ncbi:hypothetical protein H5410_047963 [Solanum commersonii]|uniref:Uncharacterized protein n=1 Tax=Solanum commersonii TaxID=4109 RepID=A0A9J5XGP4_SOLCO|nr:hypothetical protein H5410_047963 [Solanum commersonii]